MSRTFSQGLVDASHWTFVAASMADSLRKSLGPPPRSAPSIPKGVHEAARDFFRIVMEAIDGGVPTNPVASAANYGIAIHAIQSSTNPATESEEEINEILRKYSGVMKAIDPELGGTTLPPAEDIEELAVFFEQLTRDGETVAYEQFSRTDDSTIFF
jgi:hypothetical protein